MKHVFEAFRTGVAQSLRYWQVILILYLVNLLVAFFMIFFPALNLLGPAHRTAMDDAANGLDMWFLLEMLASPSTDMVLPAGTYDLNASSGFSTGLMLAAVLVGVLPFISLLVGSAAGGGALATYAGAPEPFSWRRFVWGCRRWFFPFIGIGIIEGVLFGVLFIPVLVVALPVLLTAGWAGWIFIPVLLLVAALFLALFEYMYVLAVADEKAGFGGALSGAVRLVIKRPLQVGGYYVLMLLALLAAHVIFRLGLFPLLPLEAWLLVLAAQQVFIVMRLWFRLARLAGAMELWKQVRPVRAAPAAVPAAPAVEGWRKI